jgi:hypothetical protein
MATPPMTDEVRSYLQGIIADLRLGKRTPESMLIELFFQFDGYLTDVITTVLSPHDAETYRRLKDQERPPDEISAFVQEKVPNARTVMDGAFANFRRSYFS